MQVQYEWDAEKNRSNLTKHGVDFSLVENFSWDSVVEFLDTRVDYSEKRWAAYGLIEQRLYCLVYTSRVEVIRVISLRKANIREVQNYET